MLPEEHLSTDTKDVVKLGIALIATMGALVLSLLIASAKSTYDTRRNQLLQVSADIMLLDRVLAHYEAETKDARAMLQRSVATAIAQFWPANGDRPATLDRRASSVEALYDNIQRLSPQNDVQRTLQNQASTIALDLGARVCCCSSSWIARFLFRSWWCWCSGLRSYLPLRALCSQKRNRNRGLLRLCLVGFRCDISDPGARPLVRGAASGLQRPATDSPGPARPVEERK
jgi:hypothetical protein